MVQETVTIINPTGLHMRPAGLFASTMGKFKCNVTIKGNDKEINGKSPMAIMAAVRHEGSFNQYGQVTRFTNAARLRMKESDRIASTAAMLRAFGVPCEEGPDLLTVTSTDNIRSCTVDGANDHRIVMAAAILAIRAGGPVIIRGAEAVNKSYPTFFEEYKRLGGIVDVL